MNALLFHFSSVTYAQSAKRMLEEKGISAYLLRTPLSLSPTGCGYCLKIKKSEKYAIRFIREQFSPKIKGIYEITKDGYFTEVLF